MLARDGNFLYSIAINELFLNKFSGCFSNLFKSLASTVYCDEVVELLFSIYIRGLCNGIVILILLLSICLLLFLNTGFVFLLLPAPDK